MSNHLEAGRIERRPVRFSPARDLPSAQSAISAFMLGIIATSVLIIALTYAAIGLWRVFS